MVATQRQVRAITTDLRIWALTGFLLGWPAIGILAEINVMLETAMPLVYVYQFVFHVIIRDFPGFHLFWVGFALFCFSIAAVLLSTVDWVRVRLTTSKHPTEESLTND